MLDQTAFSPYSFNHIPGTMPPGYDIRDLRKIRVELARIKDELGHHDQSDPIAQEIALWCETFEAFFIKTVHEDLDLKPVIQNAMELMKRMLRCPLPPYLPLDEEAVLQQRWADI